MPKDKYAWAKFIRDRLDNKKFLRKIEACMADLSRCNNKSDDERAFEEGYRRVFNKDVSMHRQTAA